MSNSRPITRPLPTPLRPSRSAGADAEHGIATEIATVDPDTAREWLSRNAVNRRLSVRHRDRLAADMTNGLWRLNGEPLIFDKDGNLVDGQHRLNAVVKSGRAATFLVVRGVDAGSLYSIDDGKRRSFGDLLHIGGEDHAGIIHSIVLLMCKEWGGVLHVESSLPVSNGELSEVLRGFPHVRDAARFAAEYPARSVLGRGVTGYVRLRTCEIDRPLSDLFFDQIAGRVELKPGDPAMVLRNTLMSAMGVRRTRLKRTYVLALTVKAWNALRKGRQVSYLRWRCNGNRPESFPVFEV